jgi:hypothetical protein
LERAGCLRLSSVLQGKHDDQVDSTSQFLKWATAHAMNDFELGCISVKAERDFY